MKIKLIADPSKDRIGDSWRWTTTTKGVYNTSEAYLVLASSGEVEDIPAEKEKVYKMLWKSAAPLKVTTHAWRMLRDLLTTKNNLQKRGVVLPNNDLQCLMWEL